MDPDQIHDRDWDMLLKRCATPILKGDSRNDRDQDT